MEGFREWASGLKDQLQQSLSGGPRDLSSENKHHWIPDEMSKVCYHCDAAFGVFLRRHHCRVCGHVFCWKCSNNTINLRLEGGATAAIRICNFCLELRNSVSAPSSFLDEPQGTSGGAPSTGLWDAATALPPPGRPRSASVAGRSHGGGSARSLDLGTPSAEELWILAPAPEGWRTVEEEEEDPDERIWPAREAGVGEGTVGSRGDEMGRQQVVAPVYRAELRAVASGHLAHLALQLLRQEGVQGAEGWAPIVHRLAVEAAMLISPAGTMACAQPHPNFYIKIKRAVAGRAEASAVVQGVVCRKNVTHKKMPRTLRYPRILLLRGAIEYQRSQSQLASMDTLLDQESVHLDLLVRRVLLYQPTLVLVERSVARFAQERLCQLGVVLALNVKARLMQRVARCTGATILSVPDQLGMQGARLGTCESFRLESHPDSSRRGVSQTLMFLEGCPRPLGCTIVLRGGDAATLGKVKRATHFMCFAAYAQRLETSYLAEVMATADPATRAPPPEPPNPAGDPEGAGGRAEEEGKGVVVERARGLARAGAAAAASGETGGDGGQGEGEMVLAISPYVDPGRGGGVVGGGVRGGESAAEDAGGADPRGGGTGDGDGGGGAGIPAIYSTQHATSVAWTANTRRHRVCDGPTSSTRHYYLPGDCSLRQLLRDLLPDPARTCSSPECGDADIYHTTMYVHGGRRLDVARSRLSPSAALPTGPPPLSLPPTPSSGRSNTDSDFTTGGGGGSSGGEDWEPWVWVWSTCRVCEPDLSSERAVEERRRRLPPTACALSAGQFLRLQFTGGHLRSPCGHLLHEDRRVYFGSGDAVLRVASRAVHVASIFLPRRLLEYDPEAQRRLAEEVAEQLGREVASAYGDIGSTIARLQARAAAERDAEGAQGEGGEGYAGEGGGGAAAAVLGECRRLDDRLGEEKSKMQAMAEVTAVLPPARGCMRTNVLRNVLAATQSAWRGRVSDLEGALAQLEELDLSQLVRWLEEPAPGLDVGEVCCAVEEGGLGVPVVGGDGAAASSLGAAAMAAGIGGGDYAGAAGASADDADRRQPARLMGMSMDDGLPGSGRTPPAAPGLSGSNPIGGGGGLTRAGSMQSALGAASGSGSPAYGAWGGTGSMGQAAQSPARRALQWMEEAIDGAGGGAGGSSPSPPDPGMAGALGGGVEGGGTVPSPAQAPRPPLRPGVGMDPSGGQVTPNVSEPTSVVAYMMVTPEYQSYVGAMAGASSSSSSVRREIGGGAGGREAAQQQPPLPPLPTATSTAPSSGPPQPPPDPDPPAGAAKGAAGAAAGGVGGGGVEDPAGGRGGEGGGGAENDGDKARAGGGEQGGGGLPTASSLTVPLPKESPAGGGGGGLAGEREHLQLELRGAAGGRIQGVAYFAQEFHHLRGKITASEEELVASLSRCKPWRPRGGKSSAFFARTWDERYVVKQLSRSELASFREIAPEYFRYVRETFEGGHPTALAKIVGVFQVPVRQRPGTGPGAVVQMDLAVLENLMYNRRLDRVYDLKGSTRSRYVDVENRGAVAGSGERAVLLDENLLEDQAERPILVRERDLVLLQRAIVRDTQFLASIGVMDYSLLVGVKEGEGAEVAVGIIDFMRQYTWDKALETWVKSAGILGGAGKVPTVVSPVEYMKRFRAAMARYFTVAD